MKAWVICQAGTGVGLGHLSRSLVIAKMLQARFCAEVSLLIQGEPLEREDIGVFRHQFISPNQDLAEQLKAGGEVDLLVLDLHPKRIPGNLDEVLKLLRATDTKLVGIDGLLGLRAELDLIFIPSFQFNPPVDPQPSTPIVYGWDCFLLDVERKQAAWTPGSRVLALTGGSDVTRLGATWPSLLNDLLPPDIVLDWVTGPFADKPNFPEFLRINLTEHIAPTGLGMLMRQASYAVTVFGVSFYELLYLGVPTVVFSPYGGKDTAELNTIAESGVALVAADEREATQKLVELMHDDGLARQLSERARAQICISGAQRLGSEIADLMAN